MRVDPFFQSPASCSDQVQLAQFYGLPSIFSLTRWVPNRQDYRPHAIELCYEVSKLSVPTKSRYRLAVTLEYQTLSGIGRRLP